MREEQLALRDSLLDNLALEDIALPKPIWPRKKLAGSSLAVPILLRSLANAISQAGPAEIPQVPAGAERVLMFFFPPSRIEEILGDFEEGFAVAWSRHGSTYGRWWYRWQVLCAACSRVLAVAERIAKAVSPFKS